MKKIFLLSLIFLALFTNAFSQKYLHNNYTTSKGELEVHLLGHGSLYFKFNNLVIHVDPFSSVANYEELPKADLIFLTHSHFDHCDSAALSKIVKNTSKFFYTEACEKALNLKGEILRNGSKTSTSGIKVEAVPAYNILHKREDGLPFHSKGEGNGYIFTFGDKKVYIAGDTEDIPEMKKLKKIDIAFLPMNLPYTMTPEMCANAAKMFKPKYLYPYHYGETDLSKITELLKSESAIKVILGE